MEAGRNSRADDESGPIEVRITFVIEREYKRRGVFWKLRLSRAKRIINNGTGLFFVTPEEARSIVADAEEQYAVVGEVRGLRAAYAALRGRVQTSIRDEEQRGLWTDPGREEAHRRMLDTPARFQPGDTAVFCSGSVNNDDDGTLVTIVEGYRFTVVGTADGPFVRSDGRRAEYRWGYIGRLPNGEVHFYPAHLLNSADGSIKHLRLVSGGA